MKEVQVDVNIDIERCNKSMLNLTSSRVHVPDNGICVENKNPHSPACHVRNIIYNIKSITTDKDRKEFRLLQCCMCDVLSI